MRFVAASFLVEFSRLRPTRSLTVISHGVVCAILVAASHATHGDGVDLRRITFSQDIRPILSDKCFRCHGPDENSRQAELRLDVASSAKASAIVAGKPYESELYLRISSHDDERRMPPPDTTLTLTTEEIERIRLWIEQGAPWSEHWSLMPVADVAVPKVNNQDWPFNAIDGFVLSRLEREGLRPSEEATRERLIRRLSFDLTGLPPTLEEIDSYLADPSPRAYEKVVDRLLASPRYGERMAADWLDVARYSDTYGYQVDRDRFVWPWRDWVIRAFNDNLPYDKFLTYQLAGDLLPEATDDQILATTFNRLHPQKVEGGSIPEEFRVEYVADRTQTFATGLLGLTLECARCHDHKYDPISQKEYYQLSAFFSSIDEAGLYSYFTEAVPTPTLRLADDATKNRVAAVEERIANAEAELDSLAETRVPPFQRWLQTARRPDVPGRIAHLDFEADPGGPNLSVPGRVGKGVRLTGDDGIGLSVGNFRRFDPFSVTLWMKTPDEKERAVVFHRSRAWTDAGSRGYQLLIERGRLSASLIHFWPGNAIRIRTREKIPTRQWVHVAVTYDGSSRADGLRIYVDGTPADTEIVRDNLYKNITGGGGENITIGERFRDRGFTHGSVDEFCVFDRQITPIEVAQIHDQESLAVLLDTPSRDLTERQRSALYAYYLATSDAAYQEQIAAVRKARQQRSAICDPIPEIMVMRELPQPRPTYVLRRGAYDARGERVVPDTPAVFPPFPHDQPRNRLGLARWLTEPGHPLTARVAVNRYWQMCFGRGLVATPEDFGSQGEPPTHPELLDWLAGYFVNTGWDVKRVLKTIVMSETYRQSATPTAELLAADPENRWLARGPSSRWPAEMLRDNALAVSGLLVDRIGGPPARPYEVEVSFKPVPRDKKDGLYRRSLYTYWKRTGPAPVMMTLDASKRDVCRVRRERTSSPLQAFVLLNDPQFVEAARVLVHRLIQRHGNDDEAILSDTFRLLTSRFATEHERRVIAELYKKQLAYFQAHHDRAERYLKVGESRHGTTTPLPRFAALSTVAITLMNFDGCVMKR